MPSRSTDLNPFLHAPIPRVFVATAVPMVMVMAMGGLLNVVDAAFLGHFVGADALTAVGLGFPAMMIIVALSTLVSGGMSSLLARHLGAGEREAASKVVARSHGLALLVALLLMIAYLLFGPWLVARAAGGAEGARQMAQSYLLIVIAACPIQFLLGVHADIWRSEGRMGLVAVLSILVTLANAGLNYVLIVILDLGVAGSAWGTVLAQSLGLCILLGLRAGTRGVLPLRALTRYSWSGRWAPILILGAPLSLGYVGIAVVAATVVAALRMTAGPDYGDLVAAHGIVTRILGLTYLPLMAVALATQSVVGNNFGAGVHHRADATLRLALAVSLAYCLMVAVVLQAAGGGIGRGFVEDPGVILKVGEILRPTMAAYLFTGPVLVLALYFQAIGRPGRTGVLTLLKPFMLTPVLIIAFAGLGGSQALWLAFPVADMAIAIVAAGMLLESIIASCH